MANKKGALQTSEPGTVSGPESTHPGHISAPVVDIFENDDGITLLADMPGVDSSKLTIDLNEGVLTITGPTDKPDQTNERSIMHEFEYGTFQRRFSLAETIDQAKIEARVTDGVLRLDLPRADASKPRRIQVKSA